MIHFVTYSADNMSRSRQVCVEAGKKYGADRVYEFHAFNDMSEGFKIVNASILKAERGCGYWLSKPYYISEVSKVCEENDHLVYVDAGVTVVNHLSHLINFMDQDIFLFSNGHQHCHWCKADTMDKILGFQVPASQEQVQASVMIFKINDFTRQFIREWLAWCQHEHLIDDSPSIVPNHPEFAQHRYDQAIITNLAIQYKIKLHYWADQRWYWSQRSRWPGDDYPLMFDHHRYRNKGEGKGEIEWP